ncbi:EP23 [Parapoynx stagnalis nucleopolyhedrovirus]|uniref:EP23 n=1 Tax=Parapoynx stagnalis nucleopolyhedrovirus TaxID=2993413 RepID=A0A9E7Y5K7_9ABAC|nr:EP23 [Parapoynx stagnalis nucleopolyhedrovirus]
MNIYLYQPNSKQDKNVTFIFPHKTNDVIVYLFRLGDNNDSSLLSKTRLVSGYENGRPISINLKLIPLLAPIMVKGEYVISCIRSDKLYRDLFKYNDYNKPLGCVVVQIEKEIELWHILSVRKTSEAKNTRNITGMIVHTDNGDLFYKKELIIMSGNVSVHFLQHLQKCRVQYKDLDVLSVLCENLQVDDNVTKLEKKK